MVIHLFGTEQENNSSPQQEVDAKVQLALEAQKIYETYSQQQVDRIVKAIADATYAKSLELAQLAVQETGMGVVAHKKMKNEVGSKAVYEDIKALKTVGIISENRMKKVVEMAAPYGVVAAIIPTTNPTSTAIFKVLIALKTRNAIVVSPHPYAVGCTKAALEVCEEAAVKAGAPPGLIQCLTQKSMEATQSLMTHPNTHVILATGGGGLVKAAYSSGKPAYGVGPGNVPVYVEKSAKLDKALKQIVDSKSFDYGTICATEQALIVDGAIYDKTLDKLQKLGAYLLNDVEKAKMEKVISPEVGKVNPKIVGRSPQTIAQMAGITIPTNTKIIIGIETKVGKDVPFSLEKLSPILALYKVQSSDEAKSLCLQLLNLGGRGHTLSIHTENDKLAKEFALDLPVSRIVVNTMATMGAVGGTTNLRPSFTLGCGTFGGNITSDNISAEHLMLTKRLSYGVREVSVPSAPVEQIEHFVKSTDTSAIDEALVAKIVEEVIKKLQ
ncbi:aldehyde dehydrogenase family protein [Solibacillus sp. FSL H8-0523]|uniref:aldehyde dehydrogenase family protein n=1 Tax=Solibacillus sp. FSL H8-0523 TaxID=2954511 RepID=UPI0031016C10